MNLEPFPSNQQKEMIERYNSGFLEIQSPDIQRILSIAEEMINKNSYLNIKLLEKAVRKELGLHRKDIIEKIEFLLNKKLLIEGSKYTKKTVLNNRLRRKIYYCIIASKGISFSSLKNKIFSKKKGSTGHFIWHIGMLLKFKLINKIKIGNSSFFIPIGMNEELAKLSFFCKDKITKKIISLIISANKIKRSEIYKIIGENRHNVYYRLNILLENEIIRFLDSSKKELSLNYKIIKLYKNNFEFGEYNFNLKKKK